MCMDNDDGSEDRLDNTSENHNSVPQNIERLQTQPNKFGIYKIYQYPLAYDPDGQLTLDDLAGLTSSHPNRTATPSVDQIWLPSPGRAPYYPFPNMTQYLFSSNYYQSASGEQSAAEYDGLVNLVQDPRFVPGDMAGHTAKKRDALLDRYASGELGEGEGDRLGGWKTNVPVPIQVPEGKRHWTNSDGRTFNVPGLHHRSIVEIVRNAFETNKHLHYTPYEMWWDSGDGSPPQRIYSEISSSEAFIQATHEVNTDPYFHVEDCRLEKVVSCIMAYSDSTHLAQFGSASLWPIYGFIGNADTWFRLSPNTQSDEHWAYIPMVCLLSHLWCHTE